MVANKLYDMIKRPAKGGSKERTRYLRIENHKMDLDRGLIEKLIVEVIEKTHDHR